MLCHLRPALLRSRCQIVSSFRFDYTNILIRRSLSAGRSKGNPDTESPTVQLVTTALESSIANVTQKKILTVALVGRPNTGKSTLFNRLTSSNLAIVSPVAGTTRDRKQEDGYIAGMPLIVMDTGGLDNRGAINAQIQEQVVQSLNTADVVVFMLDGQAGVTALDEHFALWIRKTLGLIEKSGKDKEVILTGDGFKRSIVDGETVNPIRHRKEILLLMNKTEGAQLSDKILDCIAEALRLGLGEPVPISASHG